jgi:LmbE family N-acetylglucosaminyl deacetylase
MLRLIAATMLAMSFQATSVEKRYTVLVVLTHGDDNVSSAPLLAKYANEGHTIHYATFPGVIDPSGEDGTPARAELLCASKALGIRETFVMRGPAGEGLPTVSAIAKRVVELINQTKPDVIITWGPDGLTGHPRHILVSTIVTRVFQQRALLTHAPRKLYYIAYPESRFPADKPPFGVIADGDNQDELAAFGTVADAFITTAVDVRPYLQRARQAIACHTLPKGKSNQKWQDSWFERLAVSLDGQTFLRLALPAAAKREAGIFEGL